MLILCEPYVVFSEMSIKNITLENIIIESRKGIGCEEATGVKIKNMQLVLKETNPVTDVLNSNSILINGLKYNDRS